MIHQRFNDFLSIVAIALGLYLVLFPVLPQVELLLADTHTDPITEEYVEEQFEEMQKTMIGPVGRPNMLFIPKIGVAGKIFQSDSPTVLDEGIWHRPMTNTPDQGGNTVFVAHRFHYTAGPNTFYHLDKVEIGDHIGVHWDDEVHTYEVSSVDVVSPNEVRIEEQTDEDVLTLYTCTPLWTAENRLVVRAMKT